LIFTLKERPFPEYFDQADVFPDWINRDYGWAS
jgi:hypothetical protein